MYFHLQSTHSGMVFAVGFWTECLSPGWAIVPEM